MVKQLRAPAGYSGLSITPVSVRTVAQVSAIRPWRNSWILRARAGDGEGDLRAQQVRVLDDLALQAELVRPAAQRLLEFAANHLADVGHERLRVDCLGLLLGALLDVLLLGRGGRVGLAPAVELVVPVADADGRGDAVFAQRVFDRAARARERGFVGRVGEQQVAVVRDDDIGRARLPRRP